MSSSTIAAKHIVVQIAAFVIPSRLIALHQIIGLIMQLRRLISQPTGRTDRAKSWDADSELQ